LRQVDVRQIELRCRLSCVAARQQADSAVSLLPAISGAPQAALLREAVKQAVAASGDQVRLATAARHMR
jgi:hypothetical protein